MALGPLLKQVRQARGVSQVDIAQELGFDRSTVSAWEQDRRIPSAVQLRSICVRLAVSSDVLLELAPFAIGPQEVSP